MLNDSSELLKIDFKTIWILAEIVLLKILRKLNILCYTHCKYVCIVDSAYGSDSAARSLVRLGPAHPLGTYLTKLKWQFRSTLTECIGGKRSSVFYNKICKVVTFFKEY